VSEREAQDGDGELARCHICEQTFPTQEELSKHLMDEHAEEATLGDRREAQGSGSTATEGRP
jgi:hypothetical protein